MNLHCIMKYQSLLHVRLLIRTIVLFKKSCGFVQSRNKSTDHVGIPLDMALVQLFDIAGARLYSEIILFCNVIWWNLQQWGVTGDEVLW